MNLDFDKYYEAPEPGRRERAYGWATAIGLQDVDGLKPSQYLISLAKENIEGRITAEEVIKRIDEHYEKRKIRQEYGTSASKAIADLHRHDDGALVPSKREQVGEQVRGQVEPPLPKGVARLLKAFKGEMSVLEMMGALKLGGRRNFLEKYLSPAIELGLVGMTQPNSPRSPTQKYRLTEKGKSLQSTRSTGEAPRKGAAK